MLSVKEHDDAEQERLLNAEASPALRDAGAAADFYKPELDKVQRRLGATHIQM